MMISQEFKEAVSEKRLIRVRVMLKDSLLLDPTFSQYEELEKYAIKMIPYLYDEHDGEIFLKEQENWDKSYLNQQMAVVVNNFSRERVDLLKEMVRYIYKDAIIKKKTELEEQDHTKQLPYRQIGVGAVVGGAVLTSAGIIASQTVLTVGGVVVMAVGGILIISDRGE